MGKCGAKQDRVRATARIARPHGLFIPVKVANP